MYLAHRLKPSYLQRREEERAVNVGDVAGVADAASAVVLDAAGGADADAVGRGDAGLALVGGAEDGGEVEELSLGGSARGGGGVESEDR